MIKLTRMKIYFSIYSKINLDTNSLRNLKQFILKRKIGVKAELKKVMFTNFFFNKVYEFKKMF
jgi:hypothetical protein